MSPSYRKSPELSRRSQPSWKPLHRSRSAGNHGAPGCCWRACRRAPWRTWCVVCGQGCAHRGRWRVDEPKCLLPGMPLWALVTFSRGTAAANRLGDSARQPWGCLARGKCTVTASIFVLSSAVVSVSWSTFGDQLALCGHIPSWDQSPANLCLFPPHSEISVSFVRWTSSLLPPKRLCTSGPPWQSSD